MLANSLALASSASRRFFHGGEKSLARFRGGGDVHGGGERVVRGLRHVYVVIRVDGLLAAHRAAGDFDGAIRDNFVDVHVGLRAAAGLPDAQRKMLVKLSGDHFVGGLRDERGFAGGELAEVLVDERGGFFEDAEGADQLGWHGVLADGEMDERAGGLRAVVAVGGDVDLAHGVGLGAGRDVGVSFDEFRHDGSWI